jgi:nitroreductase
VRASVSVAFERSALAEMRERTHQFTANIARRRSVTMIWPDQVPLDLIESAMTAAATAPSGAHQQPWQVAFAPLGTDHRRSLDEVRTIVGELPTSDMTPDIATETK